jgi:hypothetical protein
MNTCTRCGANLDPAAPACPYCHTQTPYGQRLAEQQVAYQYHASQAEQHRQDAQRNSQQEAVRKNARHAMIWSLLGVVSCCFPLALVGLVMGLNAKSNARRVGIVAPGTSTAAVIFGICSLMLFGAGVVLYIIDSQEREERIATLRTELANVLAQEAIQQRSACSLVELWVLENGFAGSSGLNVDGFQCDGKLEQTGEEAALHDVQFTTGSDERQRVSACLVRGSRWSVRELRPDGSCAAPSPAATSISAAPSASGP